MRILKALCGIGLMMFLTVQTASAKDMELKLDDERTAILHDDNTWGFNKFTVSEGDEEDIYIDIDDGRTICLKTDNTWSFTKGRPPEKRSFKELPTVSIVSTITKPTLDIAIKAATEDALKRAANKLLPYAKKSKLTHKYLVACIRHELGESGIETSYKPKWAGTAKVVLTRVQSKHVLDCVETQIESNANAPAPEPAAAAPDGTLPAPAN